MLQHRLSPAALLELISLACLFGNGHADGQDDFLPEGASLLQKTAGVASLADEAIAVSMIVDSQGITGTLHGYGPEGTGHADGQDSLLPEGASLLQRSAGLAAHDDEPISQADAFSLIVDSQGVTDTLHGYRPEATDGAVGVDSQIPVALAQHEDGAVPNTDGTVVVDSLGALAHHEDGAVPDTAAPLRQDKSANDTASSAEVGVTITRGAEEPRSSPEKIRSPTMPISHPLIIQLKTFVTSARQAAAGQEFMFAGVLAMALVALCLAMTCVAASERGRDVGHRAPRSSTGRPLNMAVSKSSAKPGASALTLKTAATDRSLLACRSSLSLLTKARSVDVPSARLLIGLTSTPRTPGVSSGSPQLQSVVMSCLDLEYKVPPNHDCVMHLPSLSSAALAGGLQAITSVSGTELLWVRPHGQSSGGVELLDLAMQPLASATLNASADSQVSLILADAKERPHALMCQQERLKDLQRYHISPKSTNASGWPRSPRDSAQEPWELWLQFNRHSGQAVVRDRQDRVVAQFDPTGETFRAVIASGGDSVLLSLAYLVAQCSAAPRGG